jgi:RNA polymerase sigma-70 factor (ECF subfamily)
MPDSREDQFSALYGWASPLIVAYALRRTSSREDAADIVAETFEIAWRRFDDIPTGRAALLWLYVTARYVLANHGRRVRRRDAIVASLAEELEGVPMRVDALNEEAVVMRSCLRSLTPDDREVLMLYSYTCAVPYGVRSRFGLRVAPSTLTCCAAVSRHPDHCWPCRSRVE